MLRTIMIGTCVSIQGFFVKSLPDGKIVVRDGTSTYKGIPVKAA